MHSLYSSDQSHVLDDGCLRFVSACLFGSRFENCQESVLCADRAGRNGIRFAFSFWLRFVPKMARKAKTTEKSVQRFRSSLEGQWKSRSRVIRRAWIQHRFLRLFLGSWPVCRRRNQIAGIIARRLCAAIGTACYKSDTIGRRFFSSVNGEAYPNGVDFMNAECDRGLYSAGMFFLFSPVKKNFWPKDVKACFLMIWLREYLFQGIRRWCRWILFG